MITNKFLFILFLSGFNWNIDNYSNDYVFLNVDSKTFRSIHYEEVIIPYQLTKRDKNDVINQLSNNFKLIKTNLILPESYSINDYRFQIITGLNVSKEKIIFIRGIKKTLPK